MLLFSALIVKRSSRDMTWATVALVGKLLIFWFVLAPPLVV
jgi:hypothetical protein